MVDEDARHTISSHTLTPSIQPARAVVAVRRNRLTAVMGPNKLFAQR
ncbi:hypothetical protein MY10362_000305 [Beauveria mimosiformis]